MRILIGAILALLLPLSPVAADDYGERLCKQYMAPGTPCACVAPILEEEFDEEELEPLLRFMRAFMKGLGGDEAAAQKTIDQIAAEHGKETLMDWLKRFEDLSPETGKTCNFKF